MDEAEAELSRLRDTPHGRLRTSLPAATHRLLLPALTDFADQYPLIELDIDFNDRVVDVIAEGMDAVIRSGGLCDSQLEARTLFSYRFVIVGAPSYFERRGRPHQPQELAEHACLRYRFPASGHLQSWPLTTGQPVGDGTAFTCNSVEPLIAAAVRGVGVACLPDFAVQQALAAGELECVLDAHLKEAGSFSLLWPSQRYLLPKLRVFVDFLGERLGAPSDRK